MNEGSDTKLENYRQQLEHTNAVGTMLTAKKEKYFDKLK